MCEESVNISKKRKKKSLTLPIHKWQWVQNLFNKLFIWDMQFGSMLTHQMYSRKYEEIIEMMNCKCLHNVKFNQLLSEMNDIESEIHSSFMTFESNTFIGHFSFEIALPANQASRRSNLFFNNFCLFFTHSFRNFCRISIALKLWVCLLNWFKIYWSPQTSWYNSKHFLSQFHVGIQI